MGVIIGAATGGAPYETPWGGVVGDKFGAVADSTTRAGSCGTEVGEIPVPSEYSDSRLVGAAWSISVGLGADVGAGLSAGSGGTAVCDSGTFKFCRCND